MTQLELHGDSSDCVQMRKYNSPCVLNPGSFLKTHLDKIQLYLN